MRDGQNKAPSVSSKKKTPPSVDPGWDNSVCHDRTCPCQHDIGIECAVSWQSLRLQTAAVTKGDLVFRRHWWCLVCKVRSRVTTLWHEWVGALVLAIFVLRIFFDWLLCIHREKRARIQSRNVQNLNGCTPSHQPASTVNALAEKCLQARS